MIDYGKIIEELDTEKIKHLLDNLKIPYKDTDKALIMPTVCHNEDIDKASWKLYYYKENHMFHCYTDCGENFSIFKFLKKYYDTQKIEYDWYEDILQVILNCSSFVPRETHENFWKSTRADYEIRKLRKDLPVYPNGIIDVFVKYYPIEWLEDSITKEVMDKYNIRYSISQNKIIIPHYNVNGELVGIRGRALNKQDIEMFGKYMPVQIEGKWYSHPLSLNLYGLNWNLENIKQNGVAFIFESEKSCMQAESFQTMNCGVASCGSNLNKFQIDLLVRTCAPKEIVVCYDNEEKKGEDKYFSKLYQMCNKYKNYCNMSFIYDNGRLTPPKASPTDCGEEIFKKLLKGRVFIR